MRKNRYGSQDRPRLPKGLSREDEDLTLTLDHFAAPMGFRIFRRLQEQPGKRVRSRRRAIVNGLR